MVEINLRENKDSLLRRIGKRLPTSADMLESPDELLVLIDVPGYDEDSIDLRFVKGSLKVHAEREEVHEDFAPVREERPERLSETVPIPAEVDIDGAEATYENGVLRVTLPKEAEVEEDAPEEDEYEEVGIFEDVEEDEETQKTAEDDEESDSEGGESEGDLPSSREELEDLSYRDLQEVAKEVGVKANQSTEDLVDGIAEELDL